MMKAASLFVLMCLSAIAFGQDADRCEQTVKTTVQAINAASSAELEPLLAEDFTIAGQSGEIAKLVLKQLFLQLGEKVNDFSKTGETRQDGEITMKYVFHYEKMGEKEATFVFDAGNKLKKLELFEMIVKTMEEDTEISREGRDLTRIPFRLIGNLMATDVRVNGEQQTFLFDSGSPKLILNRAHYGAGKTSGRSISDSQGVNGSFSNMDLFYVEEVDWYGNKLLEQEVLSIDLSHLEKELGQSIHGLVGYEMFDCYDVLIDYEREELVLIKPDYWEAFMEKHFNGRQKRAVSFEMQDHIPVVNVEIDQVEYALGIDCGAETNLLDDGLFDRMQDKLDDISEDKLIGADQNSTVVRTARIRAMKLGGKMFNGLRTTFSDMQPMNDGYQLALDGLIGYEVLSKQPILISFHRNEMLMFD